MGAFRGRGGDPWSYVIHKINKCISHCSRDARDMGHIRTICRLGRQL